MISNALSIAIAARGLVAAGWTQGDCARDADGNQCGCYEPEAQRFCILGAVYRAGYDLAQGILHVNREGVCEVFNLLQILTRSFEHISAATWNDEPDRTIDDVLALYDQAIDVLKLEAA